MEKYSGSESQKQNPSGENSTEPCKQKPRKIYKRCRDCDKFLDISSYHAHVRRHHGECLFGDECPSLLYSNKALNRHEGVPRRCNHVKQSVEIQKKTEPTEMEVEPEPELDPEMPILHPQVPTPTREYESNSKAQLDAGFPLPGLLKQFQIEEKIEDTKRRKTKAVTQYKCQFCSKVLSSRVTYTWHLRTHTGERPYRCKFCSKAYFSQPALYMHMQGKSGKCLTNNNNGGNLKSQETVQKSSHQNSKNSLCGSSSSITDENGSDDTADDDEDYFPGSKLKTCHSTKKKALYRIFRRGVEKPKRKHHRHLSEKLECQYCDKKCVRRETLENHIQSHHIGDMTFLCEHCGNGFHSREALEYHQVTCNENDLKPKKDGFEEHIPQEQPSISLASVSERKINLRPRRLEYRPKYVEPATEDEQTEDDDAALSKAPNSSSQSLAHTQTLNLNMVTVVVTATATASVDMRMTSRTSTTTTGHVQAHIPQPSSSITTLPPALHKCDFCNAFFLFPSELLRHVLRDCNTTRGNIN